MNSISNIPQTAELDPAKNFFNNYYKPEFSISQDVDSAILAHFEKITKNKESAKILASSVIYTSLATNIDPMETLAKFTTMSGDDLTAYTTLFLNLNRVGTSYLGISNSNKIGKYVERTLLP